MWLSNDIYVFLEKSLGLSLTWFMSLLQLTNRVAFSVSKLGRGGGGSYDKLDASDGSEGVDLRMPKLSGASRLWRGDLKTFSSFE